MREKERSNKMNDNFKFTAQEYAQMCQISTSALRKRRLAGKLEGQYVFKNNMYLYAPLRPNKVSGTGKSPLSQVRKRRRNIPRHKTKYTRTHMALANDVKQLARIQRVLREEQIAEITPEIFEVAKERHRQKILAKMKEPFLQTEEQKIEAEVKRRNGQWLWEREQRFKDEEKSGRWKEPLNPENNTEPVTKKYRYYSW